MTEREVETGPDVDGEPERLPEAQQLVIDIDGFEGPLDLLLTLAQRQKVDLRRISVLDLAEQYLGFVEEARGLRLELAADWLVMAAWLAYLKSRLLLPPDPAEDGPSAEDLAAHLAFQLERLEAMRAASARLMARDRLGVERFARGQTEVMATSRRTAWEATLHDLLTAYARLRTRDEFRPYAFDRTDIFALDSALEQLASLVGQRPDWTEISGFLPEEWREQGQRRRSALASSFFAALELARTGRAELRQGGHFGPLELRAGPVYAGRGAETREGGE